MSYGVGMAAITVIVAACTAATRRAGSLQPCTTRSARPTSTWSTRASSELVWEGVVEGKLTDKVMKDPRAAVNLVVTEIFKQFPV